MKHWLYAIIIIGLMVLCAVVYFFVLGNPFISPTTVILTEDGFKPTVLRVAVGDTVTFRNDTGREFWPASNVHPTHSAYPDFDPKRPLAANETWEFTFTEAGSYPFHDHLDARFEGEVVVGTPAAVDTAACAEEQSVQCWEQLITEILEEEGIKAAFDAVVQLSQTEPSFGNDCHGYAHLIGEEAYQLYVTGSDFELTPATALCGYGFYHGFMETLLLTSGDVEEARAFCRYADQKLAGQVSGASTACYHGTGHGAVDGSDPRAWGDVEAIMQPGFDLCERIAENDFQRYLCHTGVFNATEILAQDAKYGLRDVLRAPFQSVCVEQPPERLEACYTNMLPAVLAITDHDIAKAARYVNKHMVKGDTPTIEGYTTNEMTTISLMVEFIRVHGTESGYMERGIALCRAQPTEDQLPCIEGLSAGHLKYGPPGTGYVGNLAFCAHPELTDAERNVCYEQMLTRLGNHYEPQQVQSICADVPEQWREKYCPNPTI